jgi:hypothetical protein
MWFFGNNHDITVVFRTAGNEIFSEINFPNLLIKKNLQWAQMYLLIFLDISKPSHDTD